MTEKMQNVIQENPNQKNLAAIMNLIDHKDSIRYPSGETHEYWKTSWPKETWINADEIKAGNPNFIVWKEGNSRFLASIQSYWTREYGQNRMQNHVLLLELLKNGNIKGIAKMTNFTDVNDHNRLLRRDVLNEVKTSGTPLSQDAISEAIKKIEVSLKEWLAEQKKEREERDKKEQEKKLEEQKKEKIERDTKEAQERKKQKEEQDKILRRL
jgi:hypothetical protein